MRRGIGNLRKRKHNPNRRISAVVEASERAWLAANVMYTGNAAHKKNPGDFRLTPPAQPRLNKTLCDATQILEIRLAMKLLRKGASLGLISLQRRGVYPQNIWAVSDNGLPVEAQLENEATGTYHGYPMGMGDPLATEVLTRWKEATSNE